MKKLVFGMVAIASVAMVGCTQEMEQIEMNDMKNVEFTGTIVDVDTRTSMDNTGKVIWCETDPVSIFMRNGNHYKYQSNSGGTANTTFTYAGWYSKGSATLEQNYAVYPFDEGNAFDAATKKFTVDLSGLATQTYTENNFEEGKSVMTAKASDTNLPFYNALSMLNVRLNTSVPDAYRITEIKIESAKLALSGEGATIDMSGEDGRVAAELASGENTITLDCDNDNDGGVVISTDYTNFYILVPANSVEADDFTITITAIDEFTGEVYTTEETIAKDFTFERSKIVTYERPLTANSWTGSIEDVIGTNDIVMKDDHAEVSTANGLLKWAYIANNKDNTYGLKLMNDIEMPALEIEEDAVNETYKFTEKAIAVTDGVPSGSNWIPVCGGISEFSEAFSGQIEGNGKAIQGLRIKSDKSQVGFIGVLYNHAFIKNLVVEDAVVNGKGVIGAVAGLSQHGTTIENVHVGNSTITGIPSGSNPGMGGIVGLNYRKVMNDVNQDIAYIENCTTDKDTKVIATGETVGGICGFNYGAVVINCINNADVTGTSVVGGVVGYSREYYDGVNGYLIASYSTEDATITATAAEGKAGGVVGKTTNDPRHNDEEKYTEGYIVACYSLSEISAKYGGTILGYNNYSILRASWGAQNGATKITGYTSTDSNVELHSVYNFADIDAVNQDAVDAMNQVIASYNEAEGVEVTCPYTWSWTSGSWPVLVKE